ncbi:MAG: alpha/beta hydrolase [Pirellulaceae bacterium]|nr:alpha/beta hydrolase [Pirellulaceae bacterium]
MPATILRSFTVALISSLLVLPANILLGQTAEVDIRPDVVYGHKDGLALTYDVLTPKQNANGVGLLFMVSGGWFSIWAPPEQLAKTYLAPLLDQGYTVFAVRHGSSPKYVVPEIVVDVKSALKHISERAGDYGVDKSRLGVFGFSAGGHLSLILGTQTNDQGDAESAPRVAAVVAVFPPTDLTPYVDSHSLRERFPALKFDIQQAADVSPAKHVTSDDAPTLLVHGDKDELVPISHSHQIVAEFEKSNVKHQLITIEGAAHGFDAEGNKRMIDGMIQWFGEHLK